MSLDFMMYSAPSFILSIISLNKFACTPFFFCFQFVIDKQKQRVNDQRNCDRIDSFRNNNPVQIVQKVKITSEQECQKIDGKSVDKIARRDQKQRKLDILIKVNLFKKPVDITCYQIDQGIKTYHITVLDIDQKP